MSKNAESLKEAAQQALGTGGSLSGADLHKKNLRNADLRKADLSGADLRGSKLSGARLCEANLSGSDISCADLFNADLRNANLSSADLRYTDLSGADLSGAKFGTLVIPLVGHLDSKVLAEITAESAHLGMSEWHPCSASRAGWIIKCAGPAGYALKKALGEDTAAALIYASSTGRQVPDFYASRDAALHDIRRCAALEAAPSSTCQQ